MAQCDCVSCQCITFHAGSLSINRNGIFGLHYKITLLIELKIVDPL